MERKTSGDKIFALCFFFARLLTYLRVCVCVYACYNGYNEQKRTKKKRSKTVHAQWKEPSLCAVVVIVIVVAAIVGMIFICYRSSHDKMYIECFIRIEWNESIFYFQWNEVEWCVCCLCFDSSSCQHKKHLSHTRAEFYIYANFLFSICMLFILDTACVA